MHTNYVFLIDTNKRPLNPIHPARARELLSKGKANVFRVYPFTLILQTAITSPNLIPIELKIDPGSKITGLALVQNGDVIWRGNLEHRGLKIKDSLEKRKTVRRSRRNRKTRYRKARFLNRKRSDKWLPPSLMHRVLTTETWVKRLIKFAPITSISMELVKFDIQKMNNPEINGVEYQQGELFGYEVREYLLEKWGRACIYCGKKDTPLEIEHIQPKSKGGSDRVSNLTLACHCCNQKKADKPIEVFLKKKPEVLKKIQLTAKAPLKDAAAVNATRWKLFQTLKEIGLPVSTGTGGQTKFNRLKNKLEKDHSLDAACVGTTGLGVILRTDKPLIIKCFGLSNRQLVRMNKYGFPCAAARKNYKIDWKTGDIARHTSGIVGRVVVQSSKRLEVRIGKVRKGGTLSSFFQLHAADGYEYYV